MNVWIAACLLIIASAVIMTGNDCKYHFHDGATQTGIFKMLYDDSRDQTAECDFVLLNKTALISLY